MGAIFGDARPSWETFLIEEYAEEAIEEEEEEEPAAAAVVVEKKGGNKKKKKLEKVAKATLVTEEDKKPAAVVKAEPANTQPPNKKTTTATKKKESGDPLLIRGIRLAVSAWVIREIIPHMKEFKSVSENMAKAISHPTIITKGTNRQTGEEVILDDYRQAYVWLRDNTPEDARIMAWWDYGYQITGIANRTTIADGNTWNHEHIALLGRVLTSPEKDAHRIARHLADYVLVWAGGGGDDVAKSPHLLRIANSVYRGLCSEPTCGNFGMTVRIMS
jgi:dolichyl-diphosphooligosaccharide--protein glycosyltransferase